MVCANTNCSNVFTKKTLIEKGVYKKKYGQNLFFRHTACFMSDIISKYVLNYLIEVRQKKSANKLRATVGRIFHQYFNVLLGFMVLKINVSDSQSILYMIFNLDEEIFILHQYVETMNYMQKR